MMKKQSNILQNNVYHPLFIAIFLLLLCPVIFFPQHLTAQSLNTTSSSVVEIDDRQFLQLTFEVKEGGYIYADPKGPGTGRAIAFYSKQFSEVLIPKGEKYQPPQGDYVNIFKTGFSALFPLNDEVVNEQIIIEVRGLYCTDTSCEEILLTQKLRLQDLDSGQPVSIKDFITLGVSNPENEESSASATDFLMPVFTPQILSSGEIGSLIPALLFGLIAGLLLNFMPCVLPVISLKLMSLVRNSDSRKSSALGGIAYSTGILLSFSILASLSAFAGKNWGSLFQSSLFISFSVVLIISLALSYFNLYPLPQLSLSSGKKSGNVYLRSFIQGLFATLLATPCSGPFLGAVLAWTLSQKTVIIYVVFISIGIGMALPFLILSFFPALRQRLPKGGNWQSSLEKGAGFLLLASALYFLHLLQGNMLHFTLSASLAAALILALYGRYVFRLSGLAAKIAPLMTIALLIIQFLFLNAIYSNSAPISEEQFSIETLEQNRDRVTVVVFTADWCPNCQTLKATVYTPSLVSQLAAKDIRVLVADITQPGTEAETLLRSLGSRSIPFVAVFPAGSEQFLSPFCLRDMYSKKDLFRAIEAAQAYTLQHSQTNDSSSPEPVILLE